MFISSARFRVYYLNWYIFVHLVKRKSLNSLFYSLYKTDRRFSMAGRRDLGFRKLVSCEGCCSLWQPCGTYNTQWCHHGFTMQCWKMEKVLGKKSLKFIGYRILAKLARSEHTTNTDVTSAYSTIHWFDQFFIPTFCNFKCSKTRALVRRLVWPFPSLSKRCLACATALW